jgi:hypothetical protein
MIVDVVVLLVNYSASISIGRLYFDEGIVEKFLFSS